ncbi:copper homeostasis protein CutC [Phytomonospora endophytica]|uniref:PF03932 family protein CutC n=1 Tax=Phytomonospora endophytica TaxID=714109 RepID=A0A841FPR7_9ACTN|nr:copper homeostasis protein CutC [Phytomonospora endophytica]MBB6033950.1 copper homeostasis protein [Phytomonospora endophytica]GIG64529.1 copper homeostasis protein CutC [Phytomonospora endophytica]
MITYEVCVDSVAGTLAAEAGGAHRVELCAALFDGGLTPTLGTVERAMERVTSIRVHPIIRARGGDFVFDADEVAAMRRDTELFAGTGVHGIVIGALTPQGDVDVDTCRALMEAAPGLSVTFHRAFDMARDPFAALETLVELGVDRVLTSGQESLALEGAPLIGELVKAAGERIIVMPGAGVTARNIDRIHAQTGAREFHIGVWEHVESPMVHRNPHPFMGGELRRPEFARDVTSGRGVAEFVAAARRAIG